MAFTAQHHWSDIRPEIKLLLYCARTHISQKKSAKIKNLLLQNLDWDYLYHLAFDHKIIPLLYQSLKKINSSYIPEKFLLKLSNLYYSNALRNISYIEELSKLMEVFQKHYIPAIPFKGPVSAASIYNNLALRQYGDLDILIRQQDTYQAQKILLSVGYIFGKDLGWESAYICPKNQISLDLHNAIVNDFFRLPLDFDYFQPRLETIVVNHNEFLTLSPEDLLLILYVNFGKDSTHWNLRLSQLCDFAELLRTHPQICWQKVISNADKLGCKRMLLIEALVAKEMLEEPLPDLVLSEIQKDPAIRTLAAQICEKLLYQDPEEWKGFLKSRNHIFYLQMRERFRDKFFYIIILASITFRDAFMPNDKDKQIIKLPIMLSFLYYPIHWIRIIFKLITYLKHMALSN